MAGLTLGYWDDPIATWDDPYVPWDAIPVLPVVTVQIALNDGPFVASPTWTTITSVLRKMTVRRGRNHELARMDAGTVTLTFSNRDDKLNPWNTASPYYASGHGMQPMRQIRIIVTYSGITYPLFRGYIESFTPQWTDAVGADMVIEAVDAFEFLNLSHISSSAYHDAVMSDGPVAYFRLGDTGTNGVAALQIAADSSGNGYDGTYKGSVNLSVNGATPTDPNTAADMGTRTGWVELPNAAGPLSGTGDFTIEMWVFLRSLSDPTAVADRLYHVLHVGSQHLEIISRSDTTLRFWVTDGTDGGTLDSTFGPNVGLWYHVACVKSGTAGPAGWHIYVNAIDTSTNPIIDGTGNVSVTPNGSLIAGIDDNITGVESAALDAIVDEVAVYHYALTSTQVSAHYDANKLYHQVLTSGTRLSRLLDTIGWPAGLRTLDTGAFPVEAVLDPLYQTSALSYILLIADSEGYPAEVFIDASGNLVFHDRNHTTPSVTATLGDAAGEIHYELKGGTTPVRDTADLWTSAVFQSHRGSAQTYTDGTAAGLYFDRVASRTDLITAYDSNVLTMATAFVNRYSTPKDRLKTVLLKPYANPTTMYPVCLGAEIGQRFTVNRHTFPGGGTALSLDVRLEGVQHDFDAASDTPWQTSLQLAPT